MDEAKGKGQKTGDTLGPDVDGLFELPLTEFTAARNALAARLKKAGRGGEAERVKALVKPPISAWAVNQLYWKHRDAFDRLMATGERFRQAHAMQMAGKAADTRGPLAARREASSALSRLAGALLRDAGHNPTPDTMRRITTTLEALSTASPLAGAPHPGRLIDDVDPPGFESLAGLIPDVISNIGSQAEPVQRPVQPARIIPFQPSADKAANQREEARLARLEKIASAKAALQSAERILREAQTRTQDVKAALKNATAQANQAEEDRREAEERFEKARVVAAEAHQRVHGLTAEAEKADGALQTAERAVDKARKELKE